VVVSRAAALKIAIGGVLVATSCVQMSLPERMFQPPLERVLGLAVVPVSILGVSATLFTVGVILASEGVCEVFHGASLWRLVTQDPWMLLRLLACGAAAGLVLEVLAQWLGRLWYYPFWAPWFYGLLLLPGFAFYWLSIVESYLAAKAVLDAVARPRPVSGSKRTWPLGAVALLVSFALSIQWYAVHGFAFAITNPAPAAPPFAYAALAVVGVALLSGALVTALVRGYWVPWAAIVLAAAAVSAAMEIPNALHHHWAYAHFPGPAGPGGVPLTVFLAWPLQYVVFLAIPSLLQPSLVELFWRPPPWTQISRSRRPFRQHARLPDR